MDGNLFMVYLENGHIQMQKRPIRSGNTLVEYKMNETRT